MKGHLALQPDAGPMSAATRRLSLAQLSDSALPVGAFGHSFGMEHFITDGVIRDEASLSAWLAGYLAAQMACTEAMAVRLAFAASCQDAVTALDQRLTACLLPAQVRRASQDMGARLLQIASQCFPGPALTRYAAGVTDGRCHGHHCVAFALACRDLGCTQEEAQLSLLGSTVIGLAQNAIRAIPLGQSAGQRVIAAMRPHITDAVRTANTVADNRLGTASPWLEIGQMRHETQRARMFMS